MATAVYGIAEEYSRAEAIVSELKVRGFASDDISVLFADKRGTKDFVHEHHTKAPEGIAAGAGAGGLVGGVMGWLAGVGMLVIPGAGPFIAAGPLMSALSGAAVGGAVGGVAGALVGFGIPEYEARRYAGKVEKGNILISVHAGSPEQAETAMQILKSQGARDVSSAAEARVPKGR